MDEVLQMEAAGYPSVNYSTIDVKRGKIAYLISLCYENLF